MARVCACSHVEGNRMHTPFCPAFHRITYTLLSTSPTQARANLWRCVQGKNIFQRHTHTFIVLSDTVLEHGPSVAHGEHHTHGLYARIARPGAPSRFEGVTPGGVSGVRFAFLRAGFLTPSSVVGEDPDGPAPGDEPDEPAPSEGRIMNLAMLSCSLAAVALLMALIDCCAHSDAFAGDIFARRLRVMRSTTGASPGSSGLGMVTWCEQRKTWRGFRCLAVCVVGSMEIERVRVAMTFFCDDPENEQWGVEPENGTPRSRG